MSEPVDRSEEASAALQRRVDVLSRAVPADALELLALRAYVQALDEVLGTPEVDAAYERIFTVALDGLARQVLTRIDSDLLSKGQ